jgi:hypothetical protein
LGVKQKCLANARNVENAVGARYDRLRTSQADNFLVFRLMTVPNDRPLDRQIAWLSAARGSEHRRHERVRPSAVTFDPTVA